MYVVLYYRIGRIEYRLCRAVILFEEDRLGRREIMLKFKDVPNIRLPKSVNALCIIADNADILLFLGQKADQVELKRIRILILIDQNVSVAFVILFAGFGRMPQEFDRLDEQIVEI